MKQLKLTITESLSKEAAEQKINGLAKTLIEAQKRADTSDLITAVIARVLPYVPEDDQEQIYSMLLNAGASAIAAEAQLSGVLKRVGDLTNELEEVRSQQRQDLYPDDAKLGDFEEAFEQDTQERAQDVVEEAKLEQEFNSDS
ncbi:hypothetical protein D0812_22035 [Vibrio owensii]|uniref:Uncharacterized protein n=1 Tax=Vibrio owensii TaxID=696485 RepID=A0AAP9GFS5_9VIBR|nr:hypothetical protein [Vibrio owensii]AYO17071.1 hypothetical protein D0812_22035 [Vibrio owensii]QGH49217.1 hypothetical protein APZ19_19045 [Vibrio owensii]